MNFQKYRTNSIEDFLEDPDFRSWVYYPMPQTTQAWNEFLTQFPEQTHNIEKARLFLLEMKNSFEASGPNTQPVDEAFLKVLRKTMEEGKSQRKAKFRRVVFMKRFAIAASTVLVLGVFFWWNVFHSSMLTYTTAYGEWKNIELPDGSNVVLNANSELKLAENWPAGADRKVWLIGEAFFEVERKPATGAKFRVVTKDLTVEVLGTSFNVHSRDKNTEVFLEEGKVKLELGQAEEYLAPGDFITYSGESKSITKQSQAPAELHTSWKDGVLILRKQPITEILLRIEEIYGVQFQVKDKQILAQEKTVSVPMDKLEITIPILETTLNVNITQEGNLLILQ